jgi:hypothetical protein
MIAAIFPVAIRQAQGTVENTAAARVLGNAGTTYNSLIDMSLTIPPMITPTVYADATRPAAYFAMRDPRSPFLGNAAASPWARLRGQMIDSSDPRFAWSAIYSWGGPGSATPDPVVLFFVATARNRSLLGPEDLFRYKEDGSGTVDDANSNDFWATLQPKIVNATLTEGEPDTIKFLPPVTADGDNYPDFRGAAVEGALVVISDDRVNPASGNAQIAALAGKANGRVYRLGAATANAFEFELAAGEDMALSTPGVDQTAGNFDDNQNLPPRNVGAPVPTSQLSARVLLIGRGWADPTRPDADGNGEVSVGDFAGRAQDLTIQRR